MGCCATAHYLRVDAATEVDFIFSDKTGTLTRNEMRFHSAVIGALRVVVLN